jgi:hypothetical protein
MPADGGGDEEVIPTPRDIDKIIDLLEKLYNSIGIWAKAEVGKYYDIWEYDVDLKPKEKLKLLDLYGHGTLSDTICSITMPDATKPEVRFNCVFDGNKVEDYTVEEYWSLIGMHNAALYGGVNIYDTTKRLYAWWTCWRFKFSERLEVFLVNTTDVVVHVNIWDVQFQGEFEPRSWWRVGK